MNTHTHTESKSTLTLIPAMQPAHSSLLPQLELEEPDRSLLPTVDWLRSPSSPTPPAINPSVGHSFGSMVIGLTTSPVLQRMAITGKGIVQRQANQEDEEKEEEPIQAKVIAPLSVPALQRQMNPEEEDEKTIQAKAFPGQELTNFSQRYGQMVTQAKVRSVLGVPVLQRKLAIGKLGDRYEQEADRVADQVMRMPNPGINTDRAKAPQVQSLGHQCQDELKRQPITITPVNVDAVATEVEDLVDNQKMHQKALEKLDPLDMRDLLAVVAKLHEDAKAKNSAAYVKLLLMMDTNQQTQSVKVLRLRAAFDTAPTRTLRNPAPGVQATNPTVSSYRKRPGTATARAHPGDWGDDPADNTWIAHPEGIRTYFGTGTPKDRRSSAWLADNPGNADYNKAITKRAIGSFHWGKGMHDFAIYFSETDASADLRERVATFKTGTMIDYIRAHDATDPTRYLKNMQKAVPELKGDDPTTMWTTDSNKWDQLVKGFKSAEGWVEGSTITAANVGTISASPKDAAVVAYYQNLL